MGLGTKYGLSREFRALSGNVVDCATLGEGVTIGPARALIGRGSPRRLLAGSRAQSLRLDPALHYGADYGRTSVSSIMALKSRTFSKSQQRAKGWRRDPRGQISHVELLSHGAKRRDCWNGPKPPARPVLGRRMRILRIDARNQRDRLGIHACRRQSFLIPTAHPQGAPPGQRFRLRFASRRRAIPIPIER